MSWLSGLTVVVLSAAFLIAGVTAAVAFRVLADVLSGVETAIRGMHYDPEQVFSERLALLEADLEGLPRKWEQIKREASAAETRARYHASRALTELEDRGLTSPGLEAVAGELFESNADRSELQSVPAVLEAVAADPDPSDWKAITRMKKYGS